MTDLGSLGASGDLIPLTSIAGALIGLDPSFRVHYRGELTDCLSALGELGFEPINLDPKEGLALVNGTSVSAAMAAIAVHESKQFLDLTLSINALLCTAMVASSQPFDEFVHRMKPHQGQQQVAARMRALFAGQDDAGRSKAELVQDRYSIRCIPQYFGPILEGMRTIEAQIETELNSCDDNPLVDVEGERILQARQLLRPVHQRRHGSAPAIPGVDGQTDRQPNQPARHAGIQSRFGALPGRWKRRELRTERAADLYELHSAAPPALGEPGGHSVSHPCRAVQSEHQ